MALSLIVAACYACNSGADTKTTTATDSAAKPATPAAADPSSNPDYAKGLALIGGADCLTCHKVDEPLTGPTYRDVANKYAPLPDTIIRHLAGKIISGGNGVWGEVFMTPHPAVSIEDAEAMVKYILLLKK